MRIVVAGAQSEHVTSLLQDLRTILPAALSVHPWSPCVELTSSDVVLLLGLSSDSNALQEQDRSIRAHLIRTGVSFQVVYAEGAQLLPQARHALARTLQTALPDLAQALMREEIAPRWKGVCETCSDPDCEHRLFRRLLNA